MRLLDSLYSGLLSGFAEDDGEELVPGDLLDLEMRRLPGLPSADMYRRNPALLLAAAGLKYGPARDSLEKHFQKIVRSNKPYGMTVENFYNVLVAVHGDLSAARGSRELLLWLHHYSRGVARSLGAAVWLQRMHVIRVASQDEDRRILTFIKMSSEQSSEQQSPAVDSGTITLDGMTVSLLVFGRRVLCQWASRAPTTRSVRWQRPAN